MLCRWHTYAYAIGWFKIDVGGYTTKKMRFMCTLFLLYIANHFTDSVRICASKPSFSVVFQAEIRTQPKHNIRFGGARTPK